MTAEARRRRILLLTTSYPLAAGAVSGIFVRRLAQRLSRSFDLTVLTPSDTSGCAGFGTLPLEIRCFHYAPRSRQILAHGAGGIPAALATRPSLWPLVPVFLMALILACWRSAKQHDLIFANWSANGVIAGIVGRLRGVPTITTLRGSDVNTALSRWSVGLCLALSHRVVAVSEAIAQDLRRRYPGRAERVTFIPNGVEEELLRLGRQLGRPGLRLLMVGSLIPLKGVEVALDAFAGSPAESSLTLVGDGELRVELQQRCQELRVADRVHFVGQVAPEEIVHYLAQADALVLASYSEGRPNVVIEALAAGLPVIASDIPGVRELVRNGENGFLFPPGDSDCMRDCLLALADPQRRADLGAAGRAFVRDAGLTWDNSAQQYTRLFADVLGPR